MMCVNADTLNHSTNPDDQCSERVAPHSQQPRATQQCQPNMVAQRPYEIRSLRVAWESNAQSHPLSEGQIRSATPPGPSVSASPFFVQCLSFRQQGAPGVPQHPPK